MNQFIPLNETGLHASIVPIEAYHFEFYNSYHKQIRYLFKGSFNPLTGTEKIGEIDLPGGTLGKWEIFFEIRYNDCIIITSQQQKIIGGDIYELLASKEIFWVNPMGIVPRRQVYSSSPQEQEYFDDTTNKDGIEEWRRLQSKCLTENQKVLIINKT